MAGITFTNFYFRLYDGAVKSAEVIEFCGLRCATSVGP